MPVRRSPSTDPGATVGELRVVDGLAQLSFVVHGLLERRAAEEEVSIIQTRLLGVLRDRRPTMLELAQLLGLDKSSVSGLVDRAENRGLVKRDPSAEDRRVIRVALTPLGRARVDEVAARFEDDVASLLEHLSPAQRRTLGSLLSHLLVSHAADHGVDLFETIEDAHLG
jgi:DNA-binding MarR family transcriptional regulator